MYVTEYDTRTIAAYARIRLADDEVAPMTADLNSIIEKLQLITQYDFTGVEPTYHPIAGLTNVMRDDQVVNGLSREEALANAASVEDGQFRVPPILGEGLSL